MIVCGSRFCTGAESRYHPIECELLAVAWALEKTRYYTMGCEKLLILVDHKPLLGLLTTQNLGDIENPRLQYLAERLLHWNFTIKHIAGTKNFGPDALSRSPTANHSHATVSGLNYVDEDTAECSDELEGEVRAAIATRQVTSISWDTVREAGVPDQNYTYLLHVLQSGRDQQLWDSILLLFRSILS